MSIENLIDALQDGDMAAAKDAFNSEMTDRVTSAIDSKRVEVGQSFNASEAGEE